MLLECAIADSYGAAFEYANEMQQFNDLKQYYKHPRHNLLPGQYTDDTQMSIAIAEAIISNEPWTPETLAKYFVQCFKRDWRDGYARGFQKFLEDVKDGQEFLEKIRPDSDKSGAAMRAVPIGIFNNINEVIEKSTIQAKLTHDTPDGIASAQAAALASHYFAYNLGHPKKLGMFVDKYVPGYNWDEDWVGKVKSKGWMSVKAAITAIKRNNLQSTLLKDCIAFTGDTDTVATIALGATSTSLDYIFDITNANHPLVYGLENNKYGKEYLLNLDQRLFAWMKNDQNKAQDIVASY